MIFDRTKKLIGIDNFNKLQNANVVVVGVGGVGGFTAEFLVRAGVGNITIIDYDKIDITNINRQIIATTKNIGKFKVDELKLRLLYINPNLNINAINSRLCKDNINKLIPTNTNYIIDCIDDIPNKVELICYAKDNNYNIISSMGVGNRYKLTTYQVTDIYKTEQDKLAKVLRKKLKYRAIKSLDVVSSKDKPENIDGCISSISYLPPMCASVLAGFVVNRLIND